MSLPDDYSPILIGYLDDILFSDFPAARSATPSSMPSLRSPSPDYSPFMAEPLRLREPPNIQQGNWPTFMGAATPWHADSSATLGSIATAVRRHPF